MNNDRANTRSVKITKTEIDKASDLLISVNFLHDVFNQLQELRNKYRKKFMRDALTKQLFADYEAEGDIIIGLIALLNEKIIAMSLAAK